MPAVPAIIGAGAAIGGGLLGARKTRGEKMMEGVAGQQSGLAKEMAGFAKSQASMANPAMSKAMQYYMNLVQGSRGSMDAALAPERGQIAEAARGAQMGMEAKMAPGPQRDAAIADLQRQKFGQNAMLPFAARSQAVDKLGGMGMGMFDNAKSLMGGASDALGSLSNTYGNMANLQQQRNKIWGQVGGNIYTAVSPALNKWYQKRGWD